MAALHLVTADPAGRDVAAANLPPGDLVVASGPDATWEPDAEKLLLAAATTMPDADAFFGDVVVGSRSIRRPAWSPTRAFTEPAAQLPLAVRAGVLARAEVEATAPDLAAALAVAGATVGHIPTPLTRHRRLGPGPDPTALTARFAAARIACRTETGPRAGTFRLLPSGPRPPVSVVVPTAGRTRGGTRLVEQCLTSLAGHLRSDDQVLLVVGDEFDGDADPIIAAVPAGRADVIARPAGPFSFSAAVNLGLLAADNEAVLVLNDDTEVVSDRPLDHLSAHLADPSVAAVGALLRYPDGTVQHAGVVIDDARPLHCFVGGDDELLARHGADVARDVVAVTGACMLLRRRAALAAGGLSSRFPLSFNDIDLCLRLRRQGHRVVIEPAAELVHHEGATRAPVIERWEWDRWIHRWGAVTDPWYHPCHFRPDDPQHLNRNADHLDPSGPCGETSPRDTRLRPRVHHSRLA